MPGPVVRATVFAFTAALLQVPIGSAALQAPPDLSALLAAVGQRVASYYLRARSVVCTNTATVQPIDWSNWSQQGFARTVESELRVELEASEGNQLPSARLVRDIRSVNGRPPRDRDRTSRNGCTDPNPLSPEPLAFLLPPERDHYRFTAVRRGREDARAALIIDFTAAARVSRPELVEDQDHEDCFDWTGPLATRGQVWVDAETYDVLRIDRHIIGPVDVSVPARLQRRYGFEMRVVLDREDVTMRFRRVAFAEPDDVLLLPASIDSTTVVRNGLQSTRRTETFSGYRRFLTEGRITGR